MGSLDHFQFSTMKGREGLVARCLTLKIGEKSLLTGVSLKVLPGEVLAVVGPNGAGKSTLLKVLSGETSPDFGSITLNGQDLRSLPLDRQARQRAVLPQDSQLSFPFKAEEVVAMGRGPHNDCGWRENHRVVLEAMEMAEVSHLQGRYFTTLSGGERQRVQLARVLAQIWREDCEESRYLLLDEPTSALDLAHQHSVLEVASQLAKEAGVGVLAVLHDLNLAAYYADRIAILARGCLLCCGKPEEVLTAQRIEEAFGLQSLVVSHPQMDCPLVVTPYNGDEPAIKAVLA